MLRVMVVDDEQPALDLLEKLLKSNGQIEIKGTFTRSKEAIEKLKAEKVDVVFLDIEMPYMNGIEVAEHILAIDPDIDIVFVTAYNQYATDAFELNAIDYVLKPATGNRLNKTVERIVSRRSGEKRGRSGDTRSDVSQFVCLGRFEWMFGVEALAPMKWRTSKERELMAYLVHHRGKFIPKDKILEDLWPNTGVEQAATFLHTCVYGIRKKLNGLGYKHALEYKNNGYLLELLDMRCDTDDFEQAAGRDIDISPITISEYEKIAGLYRGDYMEEDGFAWTHEVQEKLKGVYILLMKRMAGYYMSVKKHHAAADCLRSALYKNPFLDDVNETMLKVYALMGDRLSMVNHYKSFTSLLQEELGIEPMASTVKLFSRLCSGHADDDPSTA